MDQSLHDIALAGLSAVTGGFLKPGWDYLRGRQKVTLAQHLADREDHRTDLAQTKANLQANTEATQAITQEWRSDRKRLRVLEHHLDLLNLRQAESIKRIADLESKERDLVEQLEATSAALAGARADVAELRAELEEIRSERDELRADLAEYREHSAALQAQLVSADMVPVDVPRRKQPRNEFGQFAKKEEETKR